MAAITATAVSVTAPIVPGSSPVVVCVSSSNAVFIYNVASSIWQLLPMNTT